MKSSTIYPGQKLTIYFEWLNYDKTGHSR
jgi:hypothetical protein